jgi:hypothetical protein
MCERVNLSGDELTFNDYIAQVEGWLDVNPHVAV